MSKILELPDSVYAALKRAAEASGTTPEGWIAAHLPAEPKILANPEAKTLADLFAGRIGRIQGGGKESYSENSREKFVEYLEEKKRKGHL